MKKILLLGIGVLLATSGLFAQDGELVWGGPGVPDSEFDGGLNNWTTVGVTNENAVWVWEEDGRADMGAYSNTTAINSPSASNGAMVFDSDFYDNAGVQGDFGLGIAPAPATGELISPVMDLSDVGAVSLKFNEYHRNFQSSNQVAYSMDGGVTWSDPIQTNSDVPTNEATSTSAVQIVSLFGATGTAEFRVKFIMDGNYYFWIVDDVQILTRQRNDMQVNTNFYAIAPSYQTPASQVDEFGFLVDITNLGGIDQTNVVVNMNITDPSGASIYSEDNEYGTVGDSLVENSSFGDFTPPAVAGTYEGTYSISADAEDVDPSNNAITFDFIVTDSVYAKESGASTQIFPAASNWGAGDPHQWAYGNHYYITNGAGHYANTATFSINADNSTGGTELDIRLYEWNDDNEDSNADPEERVLAAFAIYEIAASDGINNLRTVPLLGLDLQTAELSDNTNYIMTLEYRATDDTQDLPFGSTDVNDYNAMVLNSQQQLRPRYGSMLGIAGDIDNEPYSSVGFGRENVPVIRLNVTESPLISSQEDITLPENTVLINPNPATDVLNTELTFAENAETVSIRIMDIQGRVVIARDLENISVTNQTFDISKLAAGSYFMHVTTENGRIAKKVIVK